MFAGTNITIGNETYVVPPISLGQLRNGLMTKLKQHDLLVEGLKDDTGNWFDILVLKGEIILDALHRNYPDFDEAKLFSWLDVGNVGPLWAVIIGASGFTPGETQAAGTDLVNGT